MTGICRKEASLKIYFILQPIVVILEIVISIVDFLGFNGFIRAADMFQQGRGGAGFLGLTVSIIFLAMAVFSAFILVKVFRGRKGFKDSVIWDLFKHIINQNNNKNLKLLRHLSFYEFFFFF